VQNGGRYQRGFELASGDSLVGGDFPWHRQEGIASWAGTGRCTEWTFVGLEGRLPSRILVGG